MLETTADVYYAIASVAIAVLTVFACIALYHLIAILSRTHRLIDAMEAMMEKAGKISSYLGVLGSAAQIIRNKFSNDEGECDEDEDKPRSRKKKK